MTHQQLLRQLDKLVEGAPALPQIIRGSLFERTRRCGRATCHCASGEGHTTTYLSVAMSAGKTVQVTVPPELRPVVQAWTENYAKLWEVLEGVSAINRELLRQRLLPVPEPEGSRRRAGKRR